MRRTESPMRILITGGSGQVGYELRGSLSSMGDVIAPDRSELDLARPTSIVSAIRRYAPTLIVNAGAYTAVDRAESEASLCFAVNAEAPRVLAEEAHRIGCVLIHF